MLFLTVGDSYPAFSQPLQTQALKKALSMLNVNLPLEVKTTTKEGRPTYHYGSAVCRFISINTMHVWICVSDAHILWE